MRFSFIIRTVKKPYTDMSKKEELQKKFLENGHDRVMIRWIPSNPHGRKHKASGWVYKMSGDAEWSKLGNNYEDSIKEIDLL